MEVVEGSDVRLVREGRGNVSGFLSVAGGRSTSTSSISCSSFTRDDENEMPGSGDGNGEEEEIEGSFGCNCPRLFTSSRRTTSVAMDPAVVRGKALSLGWVDVAVA